MLFRSVKGILQQEGRVTRSKLLRMALARGLNGAEELDKLVDTLKQAGFVKVERVRDKTKPGRWPTWIEWKSSRDGLLNLLRGDKTEEPDGTTESEHTEPAVRSGSVGRHTVERANGADSEGACETSHSTGDET